MKARDEKQEARSKRQETRGKMLEKRVGGGDRDQGKGFFYESD